MKIAVSILSSNYDEEETIRRLNETDAEYLHLDVMDGHFVQNISPEREFLQNSTKPLDVHLMVSNPFSYISKYANFNTETIVIPFEIEDDKMALLEYIHSLNIKCGLAISPNTPIKEVVDYLNMVDRINIMTVEPGKGGQEMLPNTIEKIEELYNIRENSNYDFTIMADGGINDKTVRFVKLCDIIVSGSYICKSENFQERVDKLRL